MRVLLIRKDFKRLRHWTGKTSSLRVLLIRKDFKRKSSSSTKLCLRVLLIRKDFKQQPFQSCSTPRLRVLLIRKDFKHQQNENWRAESLRVLLIRKDFKPPKSSVKSSVLSSANDNLTEYRKRATNPENGVLPVK